MPPRLPRIASLSTCYHRHQLLQRRHITKPPEDTKSNGSLALDGDPSSYGLKSLNQSLESKLSRSGLQDPAKADDVSETASIPSSIHGPAIYRSDYPHLSSRNDVPGGELEAPAAVPSIFKPKKQPGRLAERRVLITGGSSTIGKAVARRFIHENVKHIILHARTRGNALAALQSIKEELGLPKDADLPITIWAADFSEPNFMDSSFGDSIKKSGQSNGLVFNTLVNCAGLTQYSLLLKTRGDQISKLLQVNLSSIISLSKLAQKQHLFRHHGEMCIVNISSLLATKAGSGASIYAASKAAVVAFSRALAAECGEMIKKRPDLPPMRVNTVLPGYIDTPMLDGLTESTREQLKKQIPLGRFGTADEVADAVCFLVTNAYANNCVLNLDGGLSAT